MTSCGTAYPPPSSPVSCSTLARGALVEKYFLHIPNIFRSTRLLCYLCPVFMLSLERAELTWW